MAVSLGTSSENRLQRGLRSSIILESLAEGLQDGPREPPKAPQGTPKAPQETPKSPQDGPQDDPRCRQDGPGRPQGELEDDGKRLRRAPLVLGLHFL